MCRDAARSGRSGYASGLSATSSLLKVLRTFRRRSAFGGFWGGRLNGHLRLRGRGLLDFGRDRQDLRDGQAPDLSDLLGPPEPLQAVDRRLEHVDRIRRAEALGEDVADAAELEHRADATTRDHARSLACGTQQHSRRAELAEDLVRDRRALLRHREQVLLRVVHRLRDRQRHLARLAVADADAVDLVADYDERREREPPAALDDLGDTVDLDHALLELALSLALDHFTFDGSGAQNLSPPSRAASASAFTRPW